MEIGDQVKDDFKLRIDVTKDPFLDERLRVKNLPDGETVKVKNPISGAEKEVKIALFKKAGEVAGARRGISEVVKWMNYVTENRVLTIAADLSESVNLEHGSLWGHYDPEKNPLGTRLKAAIQEAGNASTAIGLVGQNASLDPDKFAGVWAWSGTYGAFTPLMYLPARVWSQQNQDSKFRTGVLHILAGHSGPETAADARTHFGIFSPQVWKLFPRGQVINLSFWDYNDVAAGLFRGRGNRRAREEGRHHRRRGGAAGFPGGRSQQVRRHRRQSRGEGLYVIRDFTPGKPKHGYVVAQGSSSTFNLVKVLPKLEEAGLNVKVISAISEELFDRQPEAYRNSVLPPEAKEDLMFVTTGTKRMWPLRNVGIAHRRVLADVGPAGHLADRRPGAGRHRRSASGRRLDYRGRQALRERAGEAAGGSAEESRRASEVVSALRRTSVMTVRLKRTLPSTCSKS